MGIRWGGGGAATAAAAAAARGGGTGMPSFCRKEGCPWAEAGSDRKRARFGVEGGKPVFCSACKVGDMVDLTRGRCQMGGCGNRARYGVEGGKPVLCGTCCEDDNMVDLTQRRCTTDGCGKRARYGVEGGERVFCRGHSKPGMVNLNDFHPRCQEADCDAFAYFGEGGPTHCAYHAPPRMIRLLNIRPELRLAQAWSRVPAKTFFLSHNQNIHSLLQAFAKRMPEHKLSQCGSLGQHSRNAGAKFPGAVFEEPWRFRPDFMHIMKHEGQLYGFLQTEVDERSHDAVEQYKDDEGRLCAIYDMLRATGALAAWMPLVVLRWNPHKAFRPRISFKKRMSLVTAALNTCLNVASHKGRLDSIKSEHAEADAVHSYGIEASRIILVVYIDYDVTEGPQMCRSLKHLFVTSEELNLHEIHQLLPPLKVSHEATAGTSCDEKSAKRAKLARPQ